MYLADLHIHSRYSRATSRDLTLPVLDQWGRRKGIGLLATGDFTHPAWRAEMREQLIPAEDGLYRLREDLAVDDPAGAGAEPPRFVVSGEISTIYKKKEKTRKVHSVILLPSLEAADALAARLESIGNLHSDGRPILGMDCRDLLEIALEVCEQTIMIPAHIWTPHFSVLGEFSNFSSIEACFEDMARYIHAVETGLSSDPPMNWRLSMLDRYQLVSNSDAHSPAKLGREANILFGERSFPDLKRAIERGEGLEGTIEFFPQEGKYHLDGHRKCGVCLTPGEASLLGNVCPVCGKKLTVGVLHRVEELADRPEGYCPPHAKPYERLVPLSEVIAASMGWAASGVRVQRKYLELLAQLGPEFTILRELELEEIAKKAGEEIAQGIARMRAGQIVCEPGFDGEYGKIALFAR